MLLILRFTHVDPFEDTERLRELEQQVKAREEVSPTSIRSRILKARRSKTHSLSNRGFTHVDPFEDTESPGVKSTEDAFLHCFTHVDPFEDTESNHPPQFH